MVLPGSTNIAPPPLTRRTTVTPWRRAPSGSTSFLSDWKRPMMTAGCDHSQMRSVGGRWPAPTSSVMAASSAMCSAGGSGPGWISCQS
ncbi:Uncharacterised protein [Bordetella pertussis]|nr:Uncharacterised protein [Bordetella pertussis]